MAAGEEAAEVVEVEGVVVLVATGSAVVGELVIGGADSAPGDEVAGGEPG